MKTHMILKIVAACKKNIYCRAPHNNCVDSGLSGMHSDPSIQMFSLLFLRSDNVWSMPSPVVCVFTHQGYFARPQTCSPGSDNTGSPMNCFMLCVCVCVYATNTGSKKDQKGIALSKAWFLSTRRELNTLVFWHAWMYGYVWFWCAWDTFIGSLSNMAPISLCNTNKRILGFFSFWPSRKGILSKSWTYFPGCIFKKKDHRIYATSYLKKQADAVRNIFSNPVNTWP